MADPASPFPKHFLIVFPGLVARKARTTVMVLAKTQETEMEKMVLKMVCLKRQVTFPGQPMNKKEQRKQRRREERRTHVMFLLLALTIGVSQCRKKVNATKMRVAEKKIINKVRMTPKGSLKDK